MKIPAPPFPLAPPRYEILRPQARIHRIHDSKFSGNAFNPCQGGQTRFAPLKHRNGKCAVSSLYAGKTFDCACYETIFHDVPAKAGLKTVRRQEILMRTHTILVATRDLKLVALRNADLKKSGVGRNQLINSNAVHFSRTTPWAKAIHDQFPDAEGLVWTSNQCDPDDAYLFFGTRVKSRDFKIVNARDGQFDSTFLADVRAAGNRAGIKITI